MFDTDRLFGNRICWKIIRFFVENPSAEISQTKTIEKLGIAKLSAIKWLKIAEKNNIILKKQIGRTNIYKLNRENPVVKQIKILYNVSKLVSKIPDVKAEVYLFGSASRGEDDEKSDIDILIIGKDRSIIDKIKHINEKIKTSFFTPVQWSQISRNDPAFYERVEKDKIRLI